MADAAAKQEIEDVLSSIRRLVAQDSAAAAPATAGGPGTVAAPSAEEKADASDLADGVDGGIAQTGAAPVPRVAERPKFVLTPALRVASPSEAADEDEDEAGAVADAVLGDGDGPAIEPGDPATDTPSASADAADDAVPITYVPAGESDAFVAGDSLLAAFGAVGVTPGIAARDAHAAWRADAAADRMTLAAASAHLPTLEQTIADLELAVSARGDYFEPDGSEVASDDAGSEADGLALNDNESVKAEGDDGDTTPLLHGPWDRGLAASWASGTIRRLAGQRPMPAATVVDAAGPAAGTPPTPDVDADTGDGATAPDGLVGDAAPEETITAETAAEIAAEMTPDGARNARFHLGMAHQDTLAGLFDAGPAQDVPVWSGRIGISDPYPAEEAEGWLTDLALEGTDDAAERDLRAALDPDNSSYADMLPGDTITVAAADAEIDGLGRGWSDAAGLDGAVDDWPSAETDALADVLADPVDLGPVDPDGIEWEAAPFGSATQDLAPGNNHIGAERADLVAAAPALAAEPVAPEMPMAAVTAQEAAGAESSGDEASGEDAVAVPPVRSTRLRVLRSTPPEPDTHGNVAPDASADAPADALAGDVDAPAADREDSAPAPAVAQEMADAAEGAGDVAATALADEPAAGRIGDAELTAAVGDGGDVIDINALRDAIVEIIREELQGQLGERITRSVRKLVRREISRAMESRDSEA